MQILLKLFFLVLYICLPEHVQASNVFTQAEKEKIIKNNKWQSESSLKGLSQIYQEKKESEIEQAAKAQEKSRWFEKEIKNERKSFRHLKSHIQSEKNLRYHGLRFSNDSVGERNFDNEKDYFDKSQAVAIKNLAENVDQQKRCISTFVKAKNDVDEQVVYHKNKAQEFDQLVQVYDETLAAKYKDLVMQEMQQLHHQKKLSVVLKEELLFKVTERKKRLKKEREQAAKQERLKLQEIQQVELRKKEAEKATQLAVQQKLAEEQKEKERLEKQQQANLRKEAAAETKRLKKAEKIAQFAAQQERVVKEQQEKELSSIKIQSAARRYLVIKSKKIVIDEVNCNQKIATIEQSYQQDEVDNIHLPLNQCNRQEIMSYEDFRKMINISSKKSQKRNMTKLDMFIQKNELDDCVKILKNYVQEVCKDNYHLSNLNVLKDKIIKKNQMLNQNHKIEISYFLFGDSQLNNQFKERFLMLKDYDQEYQINLQELDEMNATLLRLGSFIPDIDKAIKQYLDKAVECRQSNHEETSGLYIEESKKLLAQKKNYVDHRNKIEQKLKNLAVMLQQSKKLSDLYCFMKDFKSLVNLHETDIVKDV